MSLTEESLKSDPEEDIESFWLSESEIIWMLKKAKLLTIITANPFPHIFPNLRRLKKTEEYKGRVQAIFDIWNQE